MSDPCDHTATDLARLIRTRDLSAREVVEAHIRRNQQIHPRLNALVVPLFEEALRAAREADERQVRGEPLGPLHGVPVSIKDMFDVAGTPTTLGLPHWATRIVSADGFLVARLRQAGAILLGKTNVPQVGFVYETDNPLYGRTNNPWNLERSPGGSSGGEAALIAARGSPLGLGSDGGGSIRQPCHSCGIQGFKPTSGRLTLLGHVRFPDWVREAVQPGPLARSVADLELAMRVLAAPGQERVDPTIAPVPLNDPAAIDIRQLRVGMYTDDGFFRAAPALRRVVREAADALQKRGVRVEEFRPPDVERAWGIYFRMFYADALGFVRDWLRGGAKDFRIRQIVRSTSVPGFLRPFVAWVMRCFGQAHFAQLYRLVPRRTASAADLWKSLDEQKDYRRQFLQALDAGGFDVILCPPHAIPALPHGTFRSGFGGSYSLLYNLLGMPAGVVAAGRVRPGEESDRPPSKDVCERDARAAEEGSAGLPIGVQVVARHWREEVALAVMAILEEHFRSCADYPTRPPL